jgi:hypothetical protein
MASRDIICPLCPQCDCCTVHWVDVPELRALVPGVDIMNNTKPCPNLRDNGCVLPREERPYRCNAYICEKGRKAWQLQ